MASFVIQDGSERIYPAQNKRIAPDFWFHPQIYRTEGEKILLPDGRGREYSFSLAISNRSEADNAIADIALRHKLADGRPDSLVRLLTRRAGYGFVGRS